MKRHSNGRGEAIDYDGSTPLSRVRDERYCQNLMSRRYETEMDAYVAAGFRRNAGNPTRLKKKPEVRMRLRWLQTQAAQRAVTAAVGVGQQTDEERVQPMRTEPDDLNETRIGNAHPPIIVGVGTLPE